MINITSNSPQVLAAMKARAVKLNRGVEIAVAKTAKGAEATAKKETPVRKGTLRRGWECNKTYKWTWTVKNEVPYAKYVEEGYFLSEKALRYLRAKAAKEGVDLSGPTKGPRKIEGRHMLAKAVHRAIPEFRAAMELAVKMAMK